jgi:uncharacterized paraquat-inducible protein A
MIRVSLSVLVLICLVLMLGPIFGAWLLSEWRRQRRERAAFRHVVHCAMCGFEHEDKTHDLLVRCPRCAALGERFPISRL